MKYTVSENPPTKDGKFGGYKVTPTVKPFRRSSYQLARLNIPLKYDNNKLLDKEKSNNGL